MASSFSSEMFLIVATVFLAGLFVLQFLKQRLGHPPATTRRRHALDNNEETDYFDLTRVPPPRPLPNFNIDEAIPRPYRPFRWKYHQTMCRYSKAMYPLVCLRLLFHPTSLALQPLESDWWLELESTYRERISQRKRLYEQHGSKIVCASPGSEIACTETMEMVVQFLCVRYPNQFRYCLTSGVLYNNILGTEVNLKITNPLVFLLENVPEDFLVVQKNIKTGLYHLRAGVSTSAVGWNMEMKMGKPLHEVHAPVPFYKEKMQSSMDRWVIRSCVYRLLENRGTRFFTKFACDKPIQRGSWGIEVGQPLYLQTDDPHWGTREVQKSDLDIQDIYLRVDWQTLRRLPKSQAILFNFKAFFTPIIHFRTEPFIPHLVATILREGERQLLDYKGSFHIEHKMLPALDEWAREQELNGWVPENWTVRTLDENPFYPGWESQHRS